MKHGIQNILKKIGDEGCYFLCLLRACGLPQSKIVDAYCECVERFYLGEDCFVIDGVAILRLFGMNVTQCLKTESPSVQFPYKVRIACYQNGRYTHFVLFDEEGKLWDPLGESNTVKNGALKSWRMYY